MIWVLTGIVLVFLIGPVRRWILGTWRFLFPGLVGAALAFILSAKVVNLGAPAWIVLACPVMAFFMIGAAGRQWFEDNLPPRNR